MNSMFLYLFGKASDPYLKLINMSDLYIVHYSTMQIEMINVLEENFEIFSKIKSKQWINSLI